MELPSLDVGGAVPSLAAADVTEQMTAFANTIAVRQVLTICPHPPDP